MECMIYVKLWNERIYYLQEGSIQQNSHWASLSVLPPPPTTILLFASVSLTFRCLIQEPSSISPSVIYFTFNIMFSRYIRVVTNDMTFFSFKIDWYSIVCIYSRKGIYRFNATPIKMASFKKSQCFRFNCKSREVFNDGIWIILGNLLHINLRR